MKLVGSIILGFAAAGMFASSAFPGDRQIVLMVSGTGSEPSRFSVHGSGDSHVVEAHATYARWEDRERVVEIVAPATLALPSQAEFTIRLQTVEGSAPIRVTVSGSSVTGADRIQMQGKVIEMIRRQSGGPVELRRADEIRVRVF